MSYHQALQNIQAGYFETAIAQLDLLLQANPAQPKLWQTKSVALLSLGHPDAAIATVEQAIRLNPQMAAAHRLLGKARLMLGDVQGAIAAYKQATRCYLDQQDKINAQACLAQIEQLRSPMAPSQPSSSQAFLEEVSAKIQQGCYGEALQDLNWLLKCEPNNVEALAQRGILQARYHDYQAAVSDFARAMKLAPNNPALRLQRGQMRLILGDAYGAITDLTALLLVKTVDLVLVYTLRGQAHQQLNDFESAFKDFSNALGIDFNNADCYKSRGNIYEEMGDLEEALANYRQAAALYLDQGNWSEHQKLQQCIQTLQPQIQAQKDEAARTIRIPIKYLSGGTPVIEVLFNGSCTFDMVLDTGASMTCLTQPMARLLNVVPTDTKQFQMADNRVVEAPVGFVNSVAVDRAQVNNLEVAILTTATHGLLGQNYLWRYDVRILRTEVELYLR